MLYLFHAVSFHTLLESGVVWLSISSIFIAFKHYSDFFKILNFFFPTTSNNFLFFIKIKKNRNKSNQIEIVSERSETHNWFWFSIEINDFGVFFFFVSISSLKSSYVFSFLNCFMILYLFLIHLLIDDNEWCLASRQLTSYRNEQS